MVPPHDDATVEVSASLRMTFLEPSELALAISPAASAGRRDVESLLVLADGRQLGDGDISRVDAGGTELVVVTAPAGPVAVDYHAVVHRGDPGTQELSPAEAAAERIVALRPSRYAPSDDLAGFATGQFDRAAPPAELAPAVARWVFAHVAYLPDATRPTGTAADTLLANAGVCRDFAHLTVALCRALNIPARMTSVYAPGLSPMDFHAVAEVLVDGIWQVLDATRLAPRQTLVRIATGRDAADTAFASTLRGDVQLDELTVTAVAHTEQLPFDDHEAPIRLR